MEAEGKGEGGSVCNLVLKIYILILRYRFKGQEGIIGYYVLTALSPHKGVGGDVPAQQQVGTTFRILPEWRCHEAEQCSKKGAACIPQTKLHGMASGYTAFVWAVGGPQQGNRIPNYVPVSCMILCLFRA